MNWTRAAETLSYMLSVCLIVRLLILRLHSVYRVFGLFLLSEVLSSSIVFYELYAHNPRLDYRLTWMAMRLVAWVLTLWMVYAFISAVLHSVPGILKFSRKLLNFIFPVAIALAALSFKPEYTASGISALPDPIDHAVGVAIVLERVIATVAILVFTAVLAFILWFPVQMPRNLALFSIGLVIYFGAETALLLLRSYFHHDGFGLVSAGVNFVLSACYVYWGLFIRRDGERVTVRMGHSWQKDEQKRLLSKLDALNAALMSAGRREIGSHTRT